MNKKVINRRTIVIKENIRWLILVLMLLCVVLAGLWEKRASNSLATDEEAFYETVTLQVHVEEGFLQRIGLYHENISAL